MLRVNTRHRCPVCGKSDWCMYTEDGSAAICQREPSDKRCGEAGYLHKLRTDDKRNYKMPAVSTRKPTAQAKPEVDWAKAVGRLAGNATDADRRILDAELGLPPGSVRRIPNVGFDQHDRDGPCWAIPMVNGAEKVVGVSRRYKGGAKKSLGNNGLFVTHGWRERPGAVFVVEGASDTAAMAAAGLCAVGRPSNTGGVGMLLYMLQNWTIDQPIIIVGERDEHDGGLWPGLLGATSVASQLKTGLKRAVKWTLPPAQFKDTREFLTSFDAGVPWDERGVILSKILHQNAVQADAVDVSVGKLWADHMRVCDELRDVREQLAAVIQLLNGGAL
jgi:hypothetical protein